ncbi:hypothetical protein [Virgisporangium aurantiacum]|nr:hypothetical protein [Virgisporangium aurantiacum]
MRRYPIALAAALLVILFAPVPAFAGPGAVDGYVWVDQPSTVDYTVGHAWRHNSTGGDITVHRPSAGVYRLTFEGMAGSGGVAHARPYGSGNTAICTVAGWRSGGSDQVVDVHCFDAAGTAADTRFVAGFTNRTGLPGTLAYLFASKASPPLGVPYEPKSWYDSTGGTPQVWRQSVGVYMMIVGTVDSHYPVDHHDGVYQVTAYGRGPARCEVHGENDETPTPIAVFCHDAAGAPVDTRFVVTYAHGVSALGTGAASANAHYSYFSDDLTSWYLAGYRNAGGATGFTRWGIGNYRVTFPGLAMGGGHATAGSRGNPSTYCHIAWWGPGDATVNCFDRTTDLPADSEFSVLMVD